MWPLESLLNYCDPCETEGEETPRDPLQEEIWTKDDPLEEDPSGKTCQKEADPLEEDHPLEAGYPLA